MRIIDNYEGRRSAAFNFVAIRDPAKANRGALEGKTARHADVQLVHALWGNLGVPKTQSVLIT